MPPREEDEDSFDEELDISEDPETGKRPKGFNLSDRPKVEKRSFPYKDRRGVWHHPKSGKVLPPSKAKSLIRNVERRLLIANVSRLSGKSQKEVRKAFKGLKTSDIVGAWKHPIRKTKDGKKVHGKPKRGKPTKKGLRALRKFGIVNADGLLNY